MLRDGDICNIDITAFIHGVHGDTNATFLVGEVDEESRLLVERTHEATMRGINAVAPGRQLNVVGRVIESYARRFGYGVVRDFTGHGIGRRSTPGSSCRTTTTRAPTTVLEPGMTFTIEPMITLGTYDVDDVGRRLDHRDRRPAPLGAVRAHGARHRHRRRRSSPCRESRRSAPCGARGSLACLP